MGKCACLGNGEGSKMGGIGEGKADPSTTAAFAPAPVGMTESFECPALTFAPLPMEADKSACSAVEERRFQRRVERTKSARALARWPPYCAAGPETTVSTTLCDGYEIAKCSEELMAMVALEKLPVMLLAVNTVKVSPTVGTKVPSSGAVNVPARWAAPVA